MRNRRKKLKLKSSLNSAASQPKRTENWSSFFSKPLSFCHSPPEKSISTMPSRISLDLQIYPNSSPASFTKEMDVKLVIPSRPLQRRQNVSFALSKNEIHRIPTWTELDESAIWYTRAEYKQLKQNCLADVSNMRQGLPECEEYCYRGLEFKKENGYQRRQSNRITARNSVFLEQDIQFDSGICSPDQISMVYQRCTSHCQFEAWERGVQDAAAVHAWRSEMDISSSAPGPKYIAPSSCPPSLRPGEQSPGRFQRMRAQ